MLSRAVRTHAAGQGSAAQQPLNLNPNANNLQRPTQQSNHKRKFERAVSSTSGPNLSNQNSLNMLHQHVQFDEADFDDDDLIDLTDSPPKDVIYPKLDSVSYPELPSPQRRSPGHQHPPPSSGPIPWSSSPAWHLEKPQRQSPLLPVTIQEAVSTEDELLNGRPAKKARTLPWAGQETCVLEEEARPGASVPKQARAGTGHKDFWSKTTSTIKYDQKEFRKRNTAARTVPGRQVETSLPSEKVARTLLSDEQKAVAKAVVEEGKSVFFTGSAGTGKSVLMRAIISQLKTKYRREADRLAITASTGLAACVIEGTTLHSWAGIGLGKEPAPELVKKIKRNAKTKTKWMRTKVLVIDEISMVDGELFDKLEQIARSIRNNGRPFGGIQIVVTGDFFQLPPVPDRNSVAKFAFDAATWNTCIEHTILLTHVFRQKDPIFAGMLNEMRLGNLSQSSVNAFKNLSRELRFEDDVQATELFPTRTEVESANNSRIQNLVGEVQTFHATDGGVADVAVRQKILGNFLAPPVLHLKKGAQVMLIKNVDTQLVNGTLGKVQGFMDESCFVTYKGHEELYHKANRGPEDHSEETRAARERFELERRKNKDTVPSSGAGPNWPMVRFPLADGTFRDMLCQPEEWKTETQQGEITAKRVQVPLILAWALSIHKAQGQTLSRVKVDLGKVFEKGQAYVALSRATSQEGLQVLRFDPKKVMVHPKVIDFYKKLGSVNDMGAKSGVPGSLFGDDEDFEDEVAKLEEEDFFWPN